MSLTTIIVLVVILDLDLHARGGIGEEAVGIVFEEPR
jgi:hypothetical protein